MRISWPKDMRAQATAGGKSLLAYAYDGPGGRYEAYSPCDDRQATLAWMMAARLHEGKSLDEAVALVKEAVAAFDARMAAKAVKEASGMNGPTGNHNQGDTDA